MKRRATAYPAPSPQLEHHSTRSSETSSGPIYVEQSHSELGTFRGRPGRHPSDALRASKASQVRFNINTRNAKYPSKGHKLSSTHFIQRSTSPSGVCTSPASTSPSPPFSPFPSPPPPPQILIVTAKIPCPAPTYATFLSFSPLPKAQLVDPLTVATEVDLVAAAGSTSTNEFFPFVAR